MAAIDKSASEKEEKPGPATGEVADDTDFEAFDLDDIEVIESKVFG